MSEKTPLRLSGVCSLLVCLLGSFTSAQTATSGLISGIVSDPSGAVIPGATVTLRERGTGAQARVQRSEEHTSELQSRGHLVCRLLLEKKKQIISPNSQTSR